MSIYEPRPISDQEFVEGFRDVVSRLDAHLELVREGNMTFRNDLANVIRILLGRDRGNQAVRRYTKRFNLPEPRVSVTAPARDSNKTILHLGSLPTSHDDEGDRELKMSTQLMREPVLFVRTADGSLKRTWQAVIDDYGNSFGAHLTQTVPRVLDAIRFYGIGPTDIGTYLLWSIGTAASTAAHQLLASVNPDAAVPAHSPYLAGTEITAILYLRVGTKDDVRARIRREKWDEPAPIVSVPRPEGDRLLFSVADGGKLALTVTDEPQHA